MLKGRGCFYTYYPSRDAVWYVLHRDVKIAISIDDELLRAADEAARRLRFSRSRLFAVAVGDLIGRHRKDEILRRLNEVYAHGTDAAEPRVVRKLKTGFRRNIGDRW
jgi:predicted transcriptional regulator